MTRPHQYDYVVDMTEQQAPSQPRHCVYILESGDGRYYTGYTTNLQRRMEEHAAGRNTGAKFTRAFGIAKLLYSEACADRSTALKREAEIKRWSRREKEAFIRAAQSVE